MGFAVDSTPSSACIQPSFGGLFCCPAAAKERFWGWGKRRAFYLRCDTGEAEVRRVSTHSQGRCQQGREAFFYLLRIGMPACLLAGSLAGRDERETGWVFWNANHARISDRLATVISALAGSTWRRVMASPGRETEEGGTLNCLDGSTWALGGKGERGIVPPASRDDDDDGVCINCCSLLLEGRFPLAADPQTTSHHGRRTPPSRAACV